MTAQIIILLLVGSGLLMAEAHLPTYGSLGAAGVAAFVVAIVLAVLDAGGSVALAVVCMRKALTVSRRRARGGAEGLIGHVGVVRRPLDPVGHVAIDGELWRARRSWAEEDEPAPEQRDPVVVHEVRGLTLCVRRAEVWEVEP